MSMGSPALQVLDEFYENLEAVGVSAVTGAGMDELFEAVDRCKAEYEKTYKPELERRRKVPCLIIIAARKGICC